MSNDRQLKKPGILFIYRYNDPTIYGGIERKILIISKWLHQQGKFSPMLLTNFPDSMFANDYKEAGFPVHSVPMNGLGGIKSAADAAEKIIEKHNVTLLHTHRFRESLAGAMVRRRLPDLVHVHRIHTHINHSEIPSWKMWLYHQLDRMAQPWVDRYIVLSDAIKNELIDESHINSGKIRVVFNGIPPLDLDPTIENTANPLTPCVAVVGTVEHRKRQEYLVKAVGALRREDGMDVRLKLVGGYDEDFGNWIKKLIAEEDVVDLVELTGYTSDVSGALENVPVVAIASDFEGIPTSIIEGMSVGRLGIATNVGGTSDLIRHEKNGFLLEPGDWKPFKNLLKTIFSAPSSRWAPLRQAGLQTYKSHFTVESMMEGLKENYQDLGLWHD